MCITNGKSINKSNFAIKMYLNYYLNKLHQQDDQFSECYNNKQKEITVQVMKLQEWEQKFS